MTASDSGKRIPSLDGLRAIAASMVILGHTVKVLHVGRSLPYGSGVVDAWGPIGVTMFFALSGYLITRLLIGERRASGEISLRAFFVRRAFRILPAYWVYLTFVAVLAAGGYVIASPHSFARAIAFTTDYVNPDSWVLNHSWSLSVEEQFYLLWPLLVVALGALGARRTALALIVIAPALRVLTFFATPQLRPSITSMLHLRVDALMVGCWLALETELRPPSRVVAFLARWQVALFGAFYCFLLDPGVRRIGVAQSALGYTVEAFCACSILLWAIRNSTSTVGRILNSRPFAHLGALSYGLYLWQQLWLSHERPTPVWMAPFLIAGAVVCAELSFRYVEAPMLRLRGKVLDVLSQRPAHGERSAVAAME